MPTSWLSAGTRCSVRSASGVLYGKLALLEAMPPYMGGGGMIRKVTIERSTYADVPARFEAGTPAVADAVGLGAAVEYLQKIGPDAIQAHEKELVAYALERLRRDSGRDDSTGRPICASTAA